MNFELLSNSVSLWWIPLSGEYFKPCILSLITLDGEFFCIFLLFAMVVSL